MNVIRAVSPSSEGSPEYAAQLPTVVALEEPGTPAPSRVAAGAIARKKAIKAEPAVNDFIIFPSPACSQIHFSGATMIQQIESLGLRLHDRRRMPSSVSDSDFGIIEIEIGMMASCSKWLIALLRKLSSSGCVQVGRLVVYAKTDSSLWKMLSVFA